MDYMHSSQRRSQIARCLTPCQDRADTTFIVKELCQRMSDPAHQSLAKLKRLARYLKRERQWRQTVSCAKKSEEVTTYSDSVTRTSSSAGVTLIGNHAFVAYTRKQMMIARSSAESELFAAALRVSESKGIVSLLFDLGYVMKPVLAIDIFHRQGIGRLNNIDVAYLWIQDQVRSKRLMVRRVMSERTWQISKPRRSAKQLSRSTPSHWGLPTWLKKGMLLRSKRWRCFGTLVQVQRFETGGKTRSSQNTGGYHSKHLQQR